jgi:hypothetical protein
MIPCEHWRDCNIPDGGCCDIKRFGGTPSHGCCAVCLQRGENSATVAPIFSPIREAPSTVVGGASFLERAASYFRAEASMILDGPLRDEAFQSRIKACKECTELDPLPEPLVGHCKRCGCGNGGRAELTVKGRMPKATCPLNRWP